MATRKEATAKKPAVRRAKTTVAKSIEAQILDFGQKVNGMGANIEKLHTMTSEIKEFAEQAKEDATLGLTTHEVEIEAKKEAKTEEFEALKAQLEADLQARKDELEAEISTRSSEFDTEMETKLAEFNAKLAAVKESISEAERKAAREIEDIEYKAKVDKRESKIGTAKFIANQYNMELVEEGTKEAADAKVWAMEEEIATKIEAAEKAAASKVYQEKGSEIGKLKNTNLMLEKELELMRTQLVKLEATVEAKDTQLAKVPQQISDAVEKANAKIDINNDNTGRK